MRELKMGEVVSAGSFKIGPVRLYVIYHNLEPGGPVVGQLVVSHVNIPTLGKFREAPTNRRVYMRFDSPEAFQELMAKEHPILREHDFVVEWDAFVSQARQNLKIHKSRTKSKGAGFLVPY
jgi:hypothetical protein